ncbi:MAG TPA: hypothetical protein VNK73_07615 [Actinomycetota bacterium]|nr:hypothetical protein [Actinomycetota bacterium]
MNAAFETARRVADAVLFEGYLLYPYRASSAKNQVRWQFGVLVPPAFQTPEDSEPSANQTECLLERWEHATLHVKVRFLQVQAREVEEVDVADGTFHPVPALRIDGDEVIAWEEGVDRAVDVQASVAELLDGELAVPFRLDGGRELEPLHDRDGRLAGRLVRHRWPVAGVVRLAGERVDDPYGLVRLRVRVENESDWSAPRPRREEALRHALVATHTLLAAPGAAFVSLLEPPEWAKAAAEACENRHTWPVLAGEAGNREVMLSSPIILYDHPAVAPESPQDLFDATEIDEILTLRTMALTDEEKQEARATDERAAALIDRVDTMPPELLERLHGAVRMLRPAGGAAKPSEPAEPAPWWDPGSDASVSPATDSVRVAGVDVARGSRVRLRPGLRRADAQDMFLDGRMATVEAVFLDVDGDCHLALLLDDDPAAELQRWHGRFLYFAPDEVEPV